MELSRNQENYIIMTVIYDELTDYTVSKGQVFRDARDLMASLSECPFEEVSPYIVRSVSETLNNYGKIVDSFTPLLVHWKWERLPLLTRSVLLMSYAHYYFVEKVDRRIVINTAVNMAKKYIDEKQGKFVNAILDKALQ